MSITQKELERSILDHLKTKKQESFSPKQLSEIFECPILSVHKAIKQLYGNGDITLVDVDGSKSYEFTPEDKVDNNSDESSTEDSTLKDDAKSRHRDKKVIPKTAGRDTTKYKFKDVEYSKGRYCLEILREYISKKKPSLEKLNKLFPAEIVQRYGVFATKKEATKLSEQYPRYFLNAVDILKTSDNQSIAVTNQWTVERLESFMGCCLKAGIALDK